MQIDKLKAWAKKKGVNRSPIIEWFLGLYRRWMYPVAERLLFEVLRRLVPEQSPKVATDLKPLAMERGWVFKVVQPTAIQQRDVSRTIAEDSLDIVKNGRLRFRNFGKRAEMYYSHLYGVTHYPVYETFTCEIPDAMLLGPTGVVITPQREALSQSVFEPLNIARLRLGKSMVSGVAQLPGSWVSLLSFAAYNYTHWIMDCLPRLALVEPRYSQFRVIIPPDPKPYQVDSLRLLGVSEDCLVEMKEQSVLSENLIFCHAAQRSGIPNAKHITRIRDRLVAAATGGKPSGVPSRRIYISRAKARRKIANEDEIMPILRDYGFERVCCEDLTLAEQICLFSQSNVVMGAHGAGMINHIFCAPGATIVEIYNTHYWEHAACRIANLVGNRHWHIFGKRVGRDLDMWVDPRKVKKVLSYALEEDSSRETAVFDYPY